MTAAELPTFPGTVHLPTHAITQITSDVAAKMNVSVAVINAKSRPQYAVLPRHIIRYIVWHVFGINHGQLAEHFNCERSTVGYSIQDIQNRCDTDPAFKAAMDAWLAYYREKFTA